MHLFNFIIKNFFLSFGIFLFAVLKVFDFSLKKHCPFGIPFFKKRYFYIFLTILFFQIKN
ncbi:Hypothetical Protein hupB [Strawberry lethal yellows phytoplasma (CPA) str. NZSb11]|uniref:Uncharacterized protein n=1 Tax=Strawberry lethal yellows phytoplasma (CPA) str. NZSb11 TaxID=980422 RepID=R4RZQ1_PHYAS|nr:Hypothetical Protein hupB [Strawberry lethal yellows phytoplasma (CPA) str. NZSb11]